MSSAVGGVLLFQTMFGWEYACKLEVCGLVFVWNLIGFCVGLLWFVTFSDGLILLAYCCLTSLSEERET